MPTGSLAAPALLNWRVQRGVGLDITFLPGVERLTQPERKLCASIRLTPVHYLVGARPHPRTPRAGPLQPAPMKSALHPVLSFPHAGSNPGQQGTDDAPLAAAWAPDAAGGAQPAPGTVCPSPLHGSLLESCGSIRQRMTNACLRIDRPLIIPACVPCCAGGRNESGKDPRAGAQAGVDQGLPGREQCRPSHHAHGYMTVAMALPARPSPRHPHVIVGVTTTVHRLTPRQSHCMPGVAQQRMDVGTGKQQKRAPSIFLEAIFPVQRSRRNHTSEAQLRTTVFRQTGFAQGARQQVAKRPARSRVTHGGARCIAHVGTGGQQQHQGALMADAATAAAAASSWPPAG